MACEHKYMDGGRCWSEGCNYCIHEIKFNGVCVACDYIDQQEFLEAKTLEKINTDKLLKANRLSLIVDLDKTLLHATSVYDVVKWIHKQRQFQHNTKTKDMITILDDRYTIKFRPGLHRFLKQMARLYEIHVYTMGNESYAKAILDEIDPKRALFQGQILTRDTNGCMNKKRLDRIFPSDTSTVVILDDCADVWNGCPNLIPIKPYEYFIGVDEVNAAPTLNTYKRQSSRQSFYRLNTSIIDQSFLTESQVKSEDESDQDTVVNDSELEPLEEQASTLEADSDFDDTSQYKIDTFSIPSGKQAHDEGDSFESYFDKYIVSIIPSQPENDTILEHMQKILTYIHHVYFKELSIKATKPNVVDILNILKFKTTSPSPKEERSTEYQHNLKKRKYSDLELESGSFKRMKSEVY